MPDESQWRGGKTLFACTRPFVGPLGFGLLPVKIKGRLTISIARAPLKISWEPLHISLD